MRCPELVRADELAERYGVRRETVLAWVRRGLVPCVRPSRKTIRFRVADVEEAIRRAQLHESEVPR
jgi:excisionase family DNA binding protein